MEELKIAVITGGHPFDLPAFHQLFRRMEGIDAYIQHLDDFGTSSDAIRDLYDVVVFYTMETTMQSDEGIWFKRNPEAPIKRLFERGQGVVVLHHSFFAFPDWSFWDDVVGLAQRTTVPEDGFRFIFDVKQTVQVEDPSHPILSGIKSFEIVDEGYHMPREDVDGHLLLTVDHPDTMKSTAWTRNVGQSGVCCFQFGHDQNAWNNASFQKVLKQGIFWVAQ